MKIALFASSTVGKDVHRILHDRGISIRCIIINREEEQQFQTTPQLTKSEAEVFYRDELYHPHVLERLQAALIDLAILAWWPDVIKEPLFRVPKCGWLNFHPSLLPYGRGKNPNFWAIVDGSPFGVSINMIDAGIDSGDIVFQKEIPTTWEDSGKSLYEKALIEIVKLFNDNIERILNYDLPRYKQDLAKGSFHLEKDMHKKSQIKLDDKYTARELLNLLRARTFPPHPAIWFEDQNEKFEVRIEIRKI
jgi:methionyl-tRNA formyltransferase